MYFGRRLVLVSTVLLAVTVAAVIGLTVRTLMAGIRQQEAGALEAVSLMMRTSIEKGGAFALAQAELLARQPGDIAAVAAGDHARLLDLQAASFAYLNAEAGVDLLQFQTGDLKTLTRLQEPNRYGEDISTTRPMVLSANHDRRGQSGIEMGRSRILALRGVAPVFDGAALAGTAEIGLNLGSLLQAVKTTSGADIAVVLPVAQGVAASDTRPVIGELLISNSTDTALFSRLLRAVTVKPSREEAQIEQTLDGVDYGLIVSPLLNYSGQPIGSVLGLRDFTALYTDLWRRVWMMLFVAAVGLTVTYSVISVAMRGLAARPLEALAAHAEAIADGEEPRPLPAMDHEAGRLARALGALAARLPPP
jgi:hypothetical protein